MIQESTLGFVVLVINSLFHVSNKSESKKDNNNNNDNNDVKLNDGQYSFMPE